MKDKPKSINEIIKSYTQEDWDRIGDQIVQQLAESEKKLAEFRDSPRFQEVINQIKQVVDPDKSLGDNPYQEPLIGDVSNEEFIKVFSVVFNFNLSGLKPQELPGPFYCEQIEFQGLKFLEIHGQGTAFIVQGPKYQESQNE